MKKLVVLCSLCTLFLVVSCDLLSELGNADPGTLDKKLTENEIIAGLKESLILGSKTAAFTLSDTSGTVNALGEITGYLANELVRIALPEDVHNAFEIVNKLNTTTAGKTLLAAAGVDLSLYRQAMIRGLNRGAENAAGLSTDVFKAAITQMSFASAKGILFGEDSLGATHYLKTTTSDILTTGFKPVIAESFGAVKVSALGTRYTIESLWNEFALHFNSVAGAYRNLVTASGSSNILTAAAANISLNALSGAGVSSVDSLNTDIIDYTTEKALDGLFYMVGKQELRIRQDPVAALAAVGDFVTKAVGDLIRKVFTTSEQA